MLIQQLVNGLTLGAVYTLLALSYSLVMGILGILNLAIAELFMIGGFIGFTLIDAGYPLPVAVLGGMCGAALIAIIVEKIGYQPLRDAPLVTPMLSTLGFSIILQNIATNIWGSDPLQLPIFGEQFEIGPVRIGEMQLIVLGATVVLVALTAYIVQKTPMGRALRAVAENREVARILGVKADQLMMLAFILSGALAGVAGVLIALHYGAITPYLGVEIGLKAIAVMVIGGTTRIWGALVAGPLIGIAEVLTVAYGGSQIRDFVVYGFMILILLLRPQGLLGGTRSDQGQRRLMSTYYASLLAESGILLLGALSVYIILATGQLSLGNGAFMGIGAYLSSWLTVTINVPLTLALVISAIVAGIMGAIVAFPALRLKGIYLAMATVGFGEMVRSFFLNFDTMGGSGGFRGMQHVSVGTIWLWAGGVLIVVMLLERSRVWLEMQAVHDDETAAGLIGLNTVTTKIVAFAAGAAVAAISGGLFAHHNVYIEPANFGFERSVEFVLAVILGGSTVAPGSLVGSLLLIFLPEFLRPIADWRLAAFGSLLVLVLLVRRQGILDRSLIRTLTFRRAAA